MVRPSAPPWGVYTGDHVATQETTTRTDARPRSRELEKELAERIQVLRGGPAHRYELQDPFAETTYRFPTAEAVRSKADELGATRFQHLDAEGVIKQVDKVDGQWWVRDEPTPPWNRERPVATTDRPLASVQAEIDRDALRSIETLAEQRSAVGMDLDANTDREMATLDAQAFRRIEDKGLQESAAVEMANNARQYPEYKAGLDNALPGYPGTAEKVYALDAENDAKIADKENRKAADFVAMGEGQRERAVAWSPQEAAAWTPREAVAQFKKDLAEYIETGDATERRDLGRDIASSAEANSFYQEAMKQSGYLLVKDSLLVPVRQNGALPLGHPADPLAGLLEPLPGKQSTPAEREAEYLSAIIGAADQLAEIGRMPARQVRDLAKVDAEMMEHISTKAARKSALSAMASAAMVQPGYKRALLDTHPTLASELATASRFAVVLSDASGKHLLDFHTHGTDHALRSFTAAVRTEMPKSEKGAEVLLVDQAERLAARALADGHGQFNMHYGQEQNRAIFETSLAGSQPDQDGWERMPSVPDAFMRANVDAGVAEIKQDGVIQPIGSIADARAWAEENHATPTDEARLVDLNMEARELHSHAPVRSTPQSSQPEVEKMQATTPTNTEVQRIGSNMPKADWQEALNLLKQKTPQGMRAAMYIPKAGGEYGGLVMMATETHVVQKVGRNTAMIHDLSKLDMDPAMKAQLEAGKIVNSRLNVKYGQERGLAATLTYNQARAGELKQELREWAAKAITNVKGREAFLKHADNFTKDLAQREVKAPQHQAPQQRRGDLARDR